MTRAAPPNRHAAHHHHHGNPDDLDHYIAKMEEPGRAEWQKPEEVVKALVVTQGQTVGDIGSGPGYFSLRFAKATGESGQVYAVDVVPKMLEVLRQRIEAARLYNITPVLASSDEPLIARGACDLILIVDTYHHFPDGPVYLKVLKSKLKKGGRIANIDFHQGDLPVGPPAEQKISREDFLKEATAAGLGLTREHTFLPYQYFVELAPRTT